MTVMERRREKRCVPGVGDWEPGKGRNPLFPRQCDAASTGLPGKFLKTKDSGFLWVRKTGEVTLQEIPGLIGIGGPFQRASTGLPGKCKKTNDGVQAQARNCESLSTGSRRRDLPANIDFQKRPFEAGMCMKTIEMRRNVRQNKRTNVRKCEKFSISGRKNVRIARFRRQKCVAK